jgi:hypothetical protein
VFQTTPALSGARHAITHARQATNQWPDYRADLRARLGPRQDPSKLLILNGKKTSLGTGNSARLLRRVTFGQFT